MAQVGETSQTHTLSTSALILFSNCMRGRSETCSICFLGKKCEPTRKDPEIRTPQHMGPCEKGHVTCHVFNSGPKSRPGENASVTPIDCLHSEVQPVNFLFRWLAERPSITPGQDGCNSLAHGGTKGELLVCVSLGSLLSPPFGGDSNGVFLVSPLAKGGLTSERDGACKRWCSSELRSCAKSG